MGVSIGGGLLNVALQKQFDGRWQSFSFIDVCFLPFRRLRPPASPKRNPTRSSFPKRSGCGSSEVHHPAAGHNSAS
jgi:hypothetical protein